jgi:hypothetical protein
MLGVAGLIPFAATSFAIRFGITLPVAVPPSTLLLAYAVMIFCFMSGTLWGFAVKANWPLGYLLSVLPVVIGFLAFATALLRPLDLLILGFIALLPIDFIFVRHGAAPNWWITLRLILSAVVVACLVAVWRALS